MKQTLSLLAAAGLMLAVAACSHSAPSGPAGQPSSSDVNPITGSRGGTNGGGNGR